MTVTCTETAECDKWAEIVALAQQGNKKMLGVILQAFDIKLRKIAHTSAYKGFAEDGEQIERIAVVKALEKWGQRQDFEKLFADRSRCPTLEAWIQNLIRYLKENAAVCKSALSSMGGDSFRRICVEDISGMMHDRLRELCRGRAVPDDYLDFLAAFYLEAVSGIMIGWIQSDMESSEEQLTRYLLIALEGSLETSLDRYVRSSRMTEETG